jgi:hypothetical protein
VLLTTLIVTLLFGCATCECAVGAAEVPNGVKDIAERWPAPTTEAELKARVEQLRAHYRPYLPRPTPTPTRS